MKIRIVKFKLSDGSSAFDLCIPEMRLSCATEKDARAMAEKLADAIDAHTVDGPATVEG